MKQYPPSVDSARAAQDALESAVTDIAGLCLDIWLPLVEQAVLADGAPQDPPPDPEAVSTVDDEWQYLIDAALFYGLGIAAAESMSNAYDAFTDAPMVTSDPVPDPIPQGTGRVPGGLPSRDELASDVDDILRRRMNIVSADVLTKTAKTPSLLSFVQDMMSGERSRTVDIVGRALSRISRDRTADAVRADTDTDSWSGAIGELSRTHSTSILNSSVSSAADAVTEIDPSAVMMIEWTAIHDAKTRKAHAHADGERVPLGSRFNVGGEKLRWPGDAAGSPENTINCRCRLLVVRESAKAKTAGSPYVVHDSVDDAVRWAVAQRDASMAETMTGTRQEETIMSGDKSPRDKLIEDFLQAVHDDLPEDHPARAALATETTKETTMSTFRSFSSVLAVRGEPTDDGRMFDASMAVSFRDFPLPLSWQKMSDQGHLSSYVVGVIEEASVSGSQIVGAGYMLDTPEAIDAAQQIEHQVTGPSVDLGDAEWELRDADGNVITMDDLWDMPMDAEFTEVVLSGKILGATLVSIPAFGQTSITLGEDVERDIGTPALVAAAALAAERRYAPPVYPAEFFTDPKFDGPTTLHITEGGRIQGHLAVFDQCHIGVSKKCEVAPMSQTDYAWFHTSPPAKTDDGATAKVGRLTVVTDPSKPGHADTSWSVGPAVAHYDNVGTCFALVHAGEDEFGIWVSGVPAPGVSHARLDAGLAAPLSGDWRWVSGNYELVAALAVNTPGYGIVAAGSTDSDGAPRALIASLGPCRDDRPLRVSDIGTLAEHVAAALRGADVRRARASAIIGAYNARRARVLLDRMEG